MHPKKAEMLTRLDETSRIHDAALKRSMNVVSHPEQFGWQRSVLTAAVVIPLTGVSAVLTDLSRVILAHSDDDAWDHGNPSLSRGDEPKSES